MTTTYQIDIVGVNADGGDAFGPRGTVYASAGGDLDIVNYVAKKVGPQIKDDEGLFVLTLAETDGINGASIRTVVQLEAKGRIVAAVLKDELATERKANRPAPAAAEPESEDTAEPVSPDVQLDTNHAQY